MIAVYVMKQYGRAVVFNLGKVAGQARGPGLIFVAPFAQRVHRVSLRIVTLPIQSLGIITKDNVSIDVSVDKNSTVVLPAPLMSTIAELGAFLERESKAADELPVAPDIPAGFTNGELVPS